MHVIFGQPQKELLGDKFTILELDTFMQEGLAEPLTTYAVIGMNDLPLTEIPMLDNHTRLHNTMLVEYRARNWNYCLQALEHLKGKWNGQLDSFYELFESRLMKFNDEALPDNWDGTIVK